jgi:RNA polymerase-binding transcription factor DksA
MNQEIIKQQLQEKLNQLEKRLTQATRDASQSHSADSEEQAQERENDEVIDVIGTETERSIKQVKIALSYLEQGEYGICSSCKKAIDSHRLEAIPESTLCYSCS